MKITVVSSEPTVFKEIKEKEKQFADNVEVIVIGRSEPSGFQPDFDLWPDRFVSRRHARIRGEKGRWWIEDLGSKHGTFVNDEDIRGKGEVPLTPGTKVQIGKRTVIMLITEETPEKLDEQKVGEVKEQVSKPVPQEPKERLKHLQKLRVEVKCLPTVNYSLIHADVPFLSEVVVFNEDDEPSSPAELQIVLPDYAWSEPVVIPPIPARGSYTVSPLSQALFDRHRLRDLPEPDIVLLQVYLNKEPVLLATSIEVKILPPNAWNCTGYELALAGFVMHNSDAVNEIICRARFELRRLIKGVQGFADALESSDPEAFKKMVKAIYLCLQERYGITYEYEPRTYDPDWQIVRFHHEVLEELEGTCIDLALLFAACLEEVHLDPLIIIVKTAYNLQHSVIGCWRNRSPLSKSEAVFQDQEKLRKWVELGEILVLDSKGFSKTKEFPDGMPFSKCSQVGMEYVKDYPLCYALDIVAARDAGISPMPFGKGLQFDRPAWLAVFRAKREAEELGSDALSARHLLLGLLSIEGGLMPQVFAKLGRDVNEIIQCTRNSFPKSKGKRRILYETDHWRAIMERAREIASGKGELWVAEAILAKALLETEIQVDRVLEHCKLGRRMCLDALNEMIEEGVKPSIWRKSGFTEDG